MENRCCVLGCLKTSNDGVKLHKYLFLLIALCRNTISTNSILL